MADGTVGVKQPVDADRLIDNDAIASGGDTVYRQRVRVAGDTLADLADVVTTEPADDAPGLVVRAAGIPPLSGTWGYHAGASGTVNVAAGQRVIGIAAHATGVGATVTIDGGDAVPLPANSQLSIAPLGKLIAPSITFSGTDSYFVEVVG